MRHLVRLVPGQLLGEEPPHPRQPGQLRERRRVTERVGQPDLLRLHAQFVQEEALAVDELPGQRLTAGHVGVGLHPHGADRRPVARPHRLLDALPHHRLVLLDPGVLLGLRAGEHQLGVVPRERGDIGEGARRLAHGLAQRPQPGGVDVGVAGGGDPVRAGVRGPGQRLGQFSAGGGRGAGDVVQVESVERVLQGAQDLVPHGVVEVQFVHEPFEDLDVQHQVPDVLDQDGEFRGVEAVQRLAVSPCARPPAGSAASRAAPRGSRRPPAAGAPARRPWRERRPGHGG